MANFLGIITTFGLVVGAVQLFTSLKKATPASPSIDVTSPLPGQIFAADELMQLVANAVDPADGNITADIAWAIDGALVGTGGLVLITQPLSAGIHMITASVVNSQGLTTQATLTVEVLAPPPLPPPPNQAPVAVIATPAAGSSFVDSDLVAFAGAATDAEDGALSGASLVWESSLSNTIIGTGTAFNVVLAIGSHLVTLTATDSQGLSGSASITISVAVAPPSAIAVFPHEDIQLAVDSNPEGTAFLLKQGIHRRSVNPKRDNVFFGEIGLNGVLLTTMSGAEALTAFGRAGSNWVVTGLTQQGQIGGQCLLGSEGCQFPEDLFFDDVPLKHVRSLVEVAPGTWFFDYANDQIIFADDPAGRKVEIGTRRVAFSPSAPDVTVQNMIVEKYAIPAQMGAIGDQIPQTGWLIEGCEVRLNHGTGITLNSNGVARGNYIHHNGQKGIGANRIGATNIVIEDNEISFNNYAGYDWGWEAGGTKFHATVGLIVRNNFVHDNGGPGLWTDGDNLNTLIDGNRITDNEAMGIYHEVSYAAIIRNNVVERNSIPWSPWLYGAQIMLSTSRDVEVHNNRIVVAAEGGNGITMAYQRRVGGAHGPLITVNNSVHHNDITHLGNQGINGGAADFDHSTFLNGNNLFDFNAYHVPDITLGRWHWQGLKNWDAFRAASQETNGAAGN